MPELHIETLINAAAERCFDLIRDPRTQMSPMPAIFGEFGLGQKVTFISTKFGIRQELTVEVVEYDRPKRLVDEMIDGNFRSFRHLHEFIEAEGGTRMIDTLIWTSPFGALGSFIDKVLVKRSLQKIVSVRNAKLKALAETL